MNFSAALAPGHHYQLHIGAAHTGAEVVPDILDRVDVKGSVGLIPEWREPHVPGTPLPRPQRFHDVLQRIVVKRIVKISHIFIY